MANLGKRSLVCMAAVLLITCWNLPVLALPIVSPVGISDTTFVTPTGLSLNRTFDQSGLSTGFTSGVTDFDTYVAGNPTHAVLDPGNAWAGPDNQTPGD